MSEFTDFFANEFSQKYLFGDFCSTAVPSNGSSDHISKKKLSNKGFIMSILQEIKNKKQKIEFLQKRFGC